MNTEREIALAAIEHQLYMLSTRYECSKMAKEVYALKVKAELYDKLRNLSASEYAAIWNEAIISGVSFESVLESHADTPVPFVVADPDPMIHKALTDIVECITYAVSKGKPALGYNPVLLIEAKLLKNGVSL